METGPAAVNTKSGILSRSFGAFVYLLVPAECPFGVCPDHVLGVVDRDRLQATFGIALVEHRKQVDQYQLADPRVVGHRTWTGSVPFRGCSRLLDMR